MKSEAEEAMRIEGTRVLSEFIRSAIREKARRIFEEQKQRDEASRK